MTTSASPPLLFAELEHTSTAYQLMGEGPPVLLMHGAEGSHRSNTAIAEALSRHATVINYDQRDCGDTKKKHAGDSTLADVARDAAELLDHLGLASVAVLGISLGGRVAQTFAIHHAERVSELFLCNTWPVDRRIADLNPGIARLRELTDRLPATAREVATMYYPDAYVDTHPVVVERIVARSHFPGRAARRALGLELPGTPPSRIRARTLLISGDQDRIVPTPVMRAMATQIADARLVTMPGVGHSPAVQEPEALARIIVDQLVHPAAAGRP